MEISITAGSNKTDEFIRRFFCACVIIEIIASDGNDFGETTGN